MTHVVSLNSIFQCKSSSYCWHAACRQHVDTNQFRSLTCKPAVGQTCFLCASRHTVSMQPPACWVKTGSFGSLWASKHAITASAFSCAMRSYSKQKLLQGTCNGLVDVIHQHRKANWSKSRLYMYSTCNHTGLPDVLLEANQTVFTCSYTGLADMQTEPNTAVLTCSHVGLADVQFETNQTVLTCSYTGPAGVGSKANQTVATQGLHTCKLKQIRLHSLVVTQLPIVHAHLSVQGQLLPIIRQAELVLATATIRTVPMHSACITTITTIISTHCSTCARCMWPKSCLARQASL